MRLFTELGPNDYREIEELVQEGKYESVEQFLRVAAQNQLAIEQSGDGPEAIDQSQEIKPSAPMHGLRSDYQPPEDPPTRPPYEKDRSELLLFSQYYRFFPLKCALHLLAEVTTDAGKPVPLEDARDYVRSNITSIRNDLVSWEHTHNIKKKDRKSTGLPKTDVKNPERSMKRYLNHYVGRIQTQKAEPESFGHDMAFMSFEEIGDTWTVGLTLTGAEFVQLKNPILEDGPEAPTLSEAERNFIATTIRNELSEEYRLMNYVFDVLGETEESYTTKLPEFREFLEESPALGDDLSDNSVRSHIGGAISRMIELGILERGARRGWYNQKCHPNEFETVSLPESE